MGLADNNFLNKEKNSAIDRYFNYILASVILVFLAGFITYGEKFRFREYTYSYIGMLRTPEGHSNTPAFLIFLTGSLFNSFVSFKISSLYNHKIYRLLFRICGTGFIMITIPCDILNTVHSFGGAMVFGSLWIFSLARINEILHSGRKNPAIIYFLVLNATLLPYAYFYFINSPAQNYAQKPAMIGLILTVKLVIREHSGASVKEDFNSKIAL